MNEQHRTYLLTLAQHLKTHATHLAVRRRILNQAKTFIVFALLDLEPVRPLIESCYRVLSEPTLGGKKPRDPITMMRALILMAHLGHANPHQLVADLKDHPERAILAGFDPLDVPGPSTFYDFIDRLADGPYISPCKHYKPPSKRRRAHGGRFVRQLKDERQSAKAKTQAELVLTCESRTQSLVRQALAKLDDALPDDFHTRINTILMLAAVAPSAKRGTLDDFSHMDIFADGSCFETSAAVHGHKICQCEKPKCKCPRAYSDPTAQWGFDSHNKRWVQGYRAHVIGTTTKGRDLPLYLSVAPANTNDVVMAIEDLCRLHKLQRTHLPSAHADHGIFDAGYDALPFYRLNLALTIKPIIPLAKAAPLEQGDIQYDSDGTPLCIGGARMKPHGLDKKTEKNRWHCPAKYLGRTNGKALFKVDLERCPLGVLCEPESKMGPLYNIPIGDDPRLQGPVPRGSEKWKKLYNKRSGAERLFSMYKHNGPQGRVKREEHLMIHLLGRSLTKHARVWADEHLEANPVDSFDALIEAIEAIAARGQEPQQDAVA